MPTVSEKNLFRRLVGDFGKDEVSDSEIDGYLDDATYELTADFTVPVLDFDTLKAQYHPEVIYKGAISWWWNRMASLADKHSMSSGAQTQSAGEKWDRAFQIIQRLEEKYDQIQMLGTDITFGNISRFSKSTLTRIGGVREEDARDGL